MNRRLVKATVAAAGAVLLAGGGATYAVFSDVETVGGNTVAAGQLDVQVTGGSTSVGPLEPGSEPATGSFTVTLSDTSTRDATVYMSMTHLIDADNGCANGVYGSEAREEEGGCLEESTTGGELGSRASLDVFVSDCGDTPLLEEKHYPAVRDAYFADISTQGLGPGDTLCVDYSVSLPAEGTYNDLQSDTLDLTFEWSTEPLAEVPR